MSALRTSGVVKSFGPVRAVDGVDLDLADGEICALLGPSGCGKTTMLRLLAGFERPDAGEIFVGEEKVAGTGTFVAPEKRRVGMVFQDYALFPHRDVAANVAYALGRRGDAARVREALHLVGLENLGGRYPHELSGGQQQRVALARALAPRPQTILLDEPFSNLDAGLRARVRQETRELLLATGVTALFVTHDQEEALSLADTVAVMRYGRVAQTGTPESVYDRPATHWVARFLGEAEVLPATVGPGAVECELGTVAVDAGFAGEGEVVVRPESIALAGQPPPRAAESLRCRVIAREYFGHDQLIHLELPSGRVVRSRCVAFPSWHPGDHVHVWIEGPVNVMPPEANGSQSSAEPDDA